MTKRRVFGLIGVCFAILVLILFYSSHQRSIGDQQITLGAILPLTGDTASYGLAAKHGIDLAIGEVNARGGINGRKVEVVYEDEQGQTSRAASAFNKLAAADKVPLIFGAASSSITLALSPLANQNKIVLITPISSSQELTEKGGPFFFRVCPSDVQQARLMAEWIHSNGIRNPALIFVNNSWGQGLRAEFKSRFSTLGGHVAAEEAIKEGDRDLRAQITKISASMPDALYAITYGKEGGALLRQVKELGFTKPIFGADVWGSPELLQTAGDAATGVKIIVPAELEGNAYKTFSSKFKKTYGQEPDIYAAYSYDMANLVAIALSRANQGGEALQEAIRSMVYDGVTGLTNFDDNGDVVGKGFERKVL